MSLILLSELFSNELMPKNVRAVFSFASSIASLTNF